MVYLKLATLSLLLFAIATLALWLRGSLRLDEDVRNRWVLVSTYLALWIAPTALSLVLLARVRH